jgi:hypothetical protein
MCPEDNLVIQYNWMTPPLKCTKSAGRECISATVPLILKFVSSFAVACTLIMALFILFLIVGIMSLIKNDHKAKLCLLCFWLFIHAFYIVMAFVGFFSSATPCISDLDQIACSVSSTLNLLLTFFFLAMVITYFCELYDRQNTTTPRGPPEEINVKDEGSLPSYSELYLPRPQENV